MKHADSAALDLFAPPVPEHVRRIHGAMEDSHAKFLHRLRTLLAGHYAGTGTEITTDQAWELMEKYGVEIPEGESHNLMGSLFSAWDKAVAVGWKRSKRVQANGNLLRVWKIDR